MKISCPKCHSTYKIDLPDPGEAGIDVQCGNCFYIFLFNPRSEKISASEIQTDTPTKTRDSNLPEDQTSGPILTPQKDEDQQVSSSEERSLQSKKQPTPSQEANQEPIEDLELEPIPDDPEPIEIVIEDETLDDSLEEMALDDIWNQAVQEGTQSIEKSPTPPPKKPVVETVDKETLEETPPPSVKKLKPLPSLEDRQREIDQIVAEHGAKQKASEQNTPDEKPQPPPKQKDPQQKKTQEEIDLEEQVVISEGETVPNWEEAFNDQAKVEAGWKKAQEQDRIQEEQQLAEALGTESTTEEKPATVPQEGKQRLVDEIFAEAKGSQESSKETAKTPQPTPKVDQKQDEVDQIFAEAKARQKKTQEEIDLEEQVVIDEEEAMPSWEEAFADQSEVESVWRKVQAEDRIHEEQQLADALGEEYMPSEPTAEEAPVTATQENQQDLVDQLSTEVPSQQETAEQPEAKAQDESLEVSGEKTDSSEVEETHTDQHTIPGAIDLMTDLEDLNMQQLVTQAFREESESQEKTEHSTPATPTMEGEVVEEPALTMESTPVEPNEEKPPFLEPVPDQEQPSIPELTLESAEEAPEPVETSDQKKVFEIESPLEMESPLETAETSEIEPEEEEAFEIESPLEMESPLETAEASEIEPEEEEEFEIESALAMEALLEAAEASDVEETAPADPSPEMEPEPKLTMESQKETVPSAFNEDELWADLLPEQNEEEPPVGEETLVASAEEKAEEPSEENDFWDQVLEKDPQESQSVETEPQPVASAPVAQDAPDSKPLTDEELWEQAFPEDPATASTTSQYSDEEEEDSQSNVPPLVIGANVTQSEEPEDSPEYDESAYGDYDDDDEFEFQRRKRKLGPFTIPHGRRGDWVIGGAMVVFLLLAGSVYFTLQTFAPGELTDIQTAETEVPEGLTPREVPLDELAGELTSPKPPKPEKTPTVDTPEAKEEAVISDPSKILEESPEEKGILKDLAESQILKDTGKSQTAKIDQSALEALTGHSVTMSTIMPVAYNPTDIRVLSFSVEIQLSDAQSAKRVRESLPVYEDIMNRTVEDFLRRKFYNDILYVKEKLQKRLQTAMNQSLKNGRVRKTKFVDFAIQ